MSLNSIRPLALSLACCVLLAGGCGSAQSELRATSQLDHAIHSQSFATGVADVREAGETDLVCTATTPSQSAGVPGLKHVVHIRVLWQQGFVIKRADRDVSQNASLRWYVFPEDGSAQGTQVAEYSGAGLVELNDKGDRIEARILQAKLTPVQVTGRMADPIGPATLSGTLVAQRNPAAAARLIATASNTAIEARGATARLSEARLPLKD